VQPEIPEIPERQARLVLTAMNGLRKLLLPQQLRLVTFGLTLMTEPLDKRQAQARVIGVLS
jgi:hypothetical protein